MSLSLELKGDEHIHCMALSPSTASMIAVSTAAGTRVWQLEEGGNNLVFVLSQYSKEVVLLFPGGAMQAKKMQLPIVAGKYSTKSLQHIFCHALRFSSDESLLAVGLPAFCS